MFSRVLRDFVNGKQNLNISLLGSLLRLHLWNEQCYMFAKRRTKRGDSLVTLRFLFPLCRSLVWDMFMLSFRCGFTLFWDPAGLLLFNTEDLRNILGANREYFILIISFEGMSPQQNACGDASLAGCSKPFSSACRNSLAVIKQFRILQHCGFASTRSLSFFFSPSKIIPEVSFHENKRVQPLDLHQSLYLSDLCVRLSSVQTCLEILHVSCPQWFCQFFRMFWTLQMPAVR